MKGIDQRRIRLIRTGKQGTGPVVYWMSREQRASDNWALLHAQERAVSLGRSMVVIFCLVNDFLNAAPRHYRFLLEGLREVEGTLLPLGIGFQLLIGEPREAVSSFLSNADTAELIVDFDPLRIKRRWLEEVSDLVQCPVAQVDAHNIVPCWLVSDRQEYGARTLRPKIEKQLPTYLTEIPLLKSHPHTEVTETETDWQKVYSLFIGKDELLPTGLNSGESAARHQLASFIRDGLHRYASDRNDPNLDGQSGLSPYLHFGQLAPQRVAMEATTARVNGVSRKAFLEELVVRRELADNFCYYNKNYDRFEGFSGWARDTLNRHKSDRRQYICSLKELELGHTHEDLWNAA